MNGLENAFEDMSDVATKRAPKQRRGPGKISATDAQVEHLPIIDKCPCKRAGKGRNTSCSFLISQPQYQTRIRKQYCDSVRSGNHRTGNAFLAAFVFIPPVGMADQSYVSRRKPLAHETVGCHWCRASDEHATEDKHEWGVDTCPNYKEFVIDAMERTNRNCCYHIPLFSEEGVSQIKIEVCRMMFTTLFKLSEARLDHIRKIAMGKAVAVPTEEKRGGHNALSRKTIKGRKITDCLDAVLEMEPSLPTQQTEGAKWKYHYAGFLSKSHFWKLFLREFGTDEDKRFLAQCERLNFYPSLQYYKEGGGGRYQKPDYENDPEGKQLKPSVSYGAAVLYWKKYDIKFEDRKFSPAPKAKRSAASDASTQSSNGLQHEYVAKKPRQTMHGYEEHAWL